MRKPIRKLLLLAGRGRYWKTLCTHARIRQVCFEAKLKNRIRHSGEACENTILCPSRLALRMMRMMPDDADDADDVDDAYDADDVANDADDVDDAYDETFVSAWVPG